jgi:hypothetical protein
MVGKVEVEEAEEVELILVDVEQFLVETILLETELDLGWPLG